MKKSEKAVLLGIISFFAFYLFNEFVLYPLGSLMTLGGDAYTKSYHMFSYTGIALLGSIIIASTYLVVSKLNELLKEIRELKAQKDL